MTVVRLHAVTRRFVSRVETVTAVDDVSVTVEAGELVGLAGPSGSGKTTLLHLIMGWERPDAGTIEHDAVSSKGWRDVAVVPQELGLLAELTARQNVELPERLAGGPRSDVLELFGDLGIGELPDRLPAELSMGEQQRVAVARAVIASPGLLVADEPTAHQDESNADRVMRLLADRAAGGGAVIVATHDDRMLDSVDRVLRMTDGRLVDA